MRSISWAPCSSDRMTQSQWTVYFAITLMEAAPAISWPKAVAFGFACRRDTEPEAAARVVAGLLRGKGPGPGPASGWDLWQGDPASVMAPVLH